jgi:hypothetical protein
MAAFSISATDNESGRIAVRDVLQQLFRLRGPPGGWAMMPEANKANNDTANTPVEICRTGFLPERSIVPSCLSRRSHLKEHRRAKRLRRRSGRNDHMGGVLLASAL